MHQRSFVNVAYVVSVLFRPLINGNEGGREMSNQVGKAGLLILAQNLFFGLVWGSNYEMDMLRLKFTLRGK